MASSLSPFGMIVVVPTLAAVADRYGVGQGRAQFLIAAYLFGLGVGQPVVGALSDRYGRRPVILAGFGLFTAASVACALATGFTALLLCRLLQALGVSVGTVGSRAIVRDTHDALGTVRALGFIGAAMGIAPVLGPLIGGALTTWLGPQSVFFVSAGLGLLVTVAMALRLAETRQVTGLLQERQHWLTSYRDLLGSRVFVGYTLMYAFLQGCFFAFLAVAAVVFADHLAVNEATFGAIWGAMGLTYVAGAWIGARLTTQLGSRRLLLVSTSMILGAGAGLLTGTLIWGVTMSGLLVPLTLLMFAAGVQTPLSVAGAVNHRQDMAGTAAGLSSSLALVLSGSFSIAAGYLYTGDFLPVAALIATSAALVGITYRMTRQAE
ncbi:MAG: MFS transporter [Gammaproteobacteria bacterium]|nr:MFS transporter [Gammaproteobacteria bacterium]